MTGELVLIENERFVRFVEDRIDWRQTDPVEGHAGELFMRINPKHITWMRVMEKV